jgi:gas vesicle protein
MKTKESNNSKIILAALAGAAIGVAIGYFLNSDKRDEILKNLKAEASKLKDDLSEKFDDLKNSAQEHLKNQTN